MKSLLNPMLVCGRFVLWVCAWSGALQAAEPAIHQTHMVPMRDGVKLATDVWRPHTNGPVPVILARTPYNKRAASTLGPDGAARGYAFVIQDVRGRFGSEGENLPFHLDVPDGYDTLQWIAKQSWCNGRIGTWGGSAGAITQFQMAASDTTLLSAQHLTVGAPNLYEVVYQGGVFRKALIEDWIGSQKFQSNALSRWVEHSRYDDYWKARDASRHYATMNAPAVHIGGYWDIFTQATIDGFVGYQTQGGPQARGRQHLILGPWTHGVLRDQAGEWKFPNAKAPPMRAHDPWRWFDYTLRGQSNGFEKTPSVFYYVIGDVYDTNSTGNFWRAAEAWPPGNTHATPWYLTSERGLTREPRAESAHLELSANPTNPVPTVGGVQLTIPAGPMEQGKVEQRPDVLVFTSAPVDKAFEVTGRVRMKLYVSTDTPDADFIARLCDVYPDGRSFNLCEGSVRARFREGFDREALLKPGEVYELNLDLWSTSVVFNPGHRLRVQVASTSFPGYDPNPNTGETLRASTATKVAHEKVYVHGRRPSHILLPMAQVIEPAFTP